MMRRWEIPVAAVSLVAAFALLNGGRAADVAEPVAPVVAEASAPAQRPAEQAEGPALKPQPAVVEGLPAAVSDVLAVNGHTEFVERSILVEQLPPAVVAVLIEHGAVLRIADEGDAVP